MGKPTKNRKIHNTTDFDKINYVLLLVFKEKKKLKLGIFP